MVVQPMDGGQVLVGGEIKQGGARVFTIRPDDAKNPVTIGYISTK